MARARLRGTLASYVLIVLPSCGLALASACGAPQASTVAPSASSTGPAASASAPAPRAFASSAIAAQTLIQDQIEANAKPLSQCVDAYRVSMNMPHGPVTADIGIDQEGRLLGIVLVVPKPPDAGPKLKDCLWAALHGLPFPRSHSGVITIRQSFTDTALSP